MKYMRNEEGFTGLEAAIVLIAFVVVAAVFSYVMLGAGFFTSQKSQEVVHTSVDTASASLEIRGDVIGRNISATTKDKIDVIEFAVAQTAGGTPVDLNSTVLTYATDNGVWILDQVYKYSDLKAGKWYLNESINGDGDTLVEKGELAILQAQIDGTGKAGETPASLAANEHFNLEIQPADGAALGLKRTAPPQIDHVNLLY